MHQYFLDVFVMSDDLGVRDSRLRLMKAISDRCAKVARLELLAT
jgi:glycyl-tRNA synthetase beta chain